MPTVTAGTNCLTKAQDDVAAGLATLAAFQAITETADATEAANKVFLDYWPKAWDGEAITKQQAEQLLAGAMVKPPDENAYVYDIVNGRPRAAGRMEIKIIRVVRDCDEILADENDRLARNWIGDLVQQLAAWSEANQGHNWMGPVTIAYGPNHRGRKSRITAGHVYEAMLTFAWGNVGLRGGIGGG